MDSRSVIPPPRPGGAVRTVQRRAAQPAPLLNERRGTTVFTMLRSRRSRCRDPCSRSSDLGVHDGPIFAFTMGRSHGTIVEERRCATDALKAYLGRRAK